MCTNGNTLMDVKDEAGKQAHVVPRLISAMSLVPEVHKHKAAVVRFTRVY
jgi:hypothetical protein